MAGLSQGCDRLPDPPFPAPGAAVLLTAEGGDRVLRLLSARPRRVAVIDRNPAQLHLAWLKLAAVKALGHSEYLELAGFRPSRRRRALYVRVRWLLPRETDEFWLARPGLLDAGLAGQGTFERRLAAFRRFALLVQGGAKLGRLCALDSEEERRLAYRSEWGSFLWKRFAPWVWERAFEASAATMERLLVEGRIFSPPPALPPAGFEAAKELANRVLIVDEGPGDYLRALPERSVDAFMLGGMDLGGLERDLARAAAPGARATFVTGPPPARLPEGFVAEGSPCEAGFFPGWLVAARFAACVTSSAP